jgi:hypothetical protein
MRSLPVKNLVRVEHPDDPYVISVVMESAGDQALPGRCMLLEPGNVSSGVKTDELLRRW